MGTPEIGNFMLNFNFSSHFLLHIVDSIKMVTEGRDRGTVELTFYVP